MKSGSLINDTIHQELRTYIFSYLPFKDSIKVQLTCRAWNELNNKNYWKKKIESFFPYLIEQNNAEFTYNFEEIYHKECAAYQKGLKSKKCLHLFNDVLNCLNGDVSNVSKKNTNEQFILYSYAIANGHFDALKNVPDGGLQGLKIAVKNNHVRVVRDFIYHLNVPPNISNDLLILAAKKGRTSIVKILLENLLNIPIKCQSYALVHAAIRNHVDTVAFLLENCPNILLKYKTLALLWAAAKGQCELVKLLQSGNDITPDNVELALHSACTEGHLNVVKFYIEKSPSLDFQYQYQALQHAVISGQLNVVMYLTNNIPGISDISQKMKEDMFRVALYQSNKEVVTYLSSIWPELFLSNMQDEEDLSLSAKFSFYACAIEHGQKQNLDHLLEVCPVDVSVHERGLSFSFAAKHGHIDIMQLILRKNEIPFCYKASAFTYAMLHFNVSVALYLIQNILGFGSTEVNANEKSKIKNR